ncbi:hypothetical protein N0M98_10730 [Paenibacillus doosanensis]|uniref:hypothetical protein n=1 Tax=Paenibacillus doosanensis TaxID=1229154 RepID=UPI0021805DD7|nr:hypothetical protein [Paenibacillus doosanensis]MCS7460616.1 hypothetical protein [Paenibacillus doosanensis]
MIRYEFDEFVSVGRIGIVRIVHQPLQPGIQGDLLGHLLDILQLAVQHLAELLQHRQIRPVGVIGHNRIGLRVQNRSKGKRKQENGQIRQ